MADRAGGPPDGDGGPLDLARDLIGSVLDEFGENAARARGMQKRHPMTLCSRAGFLVDQAHIGGLQEREFSHDVVRPVRDVMQGLTSPLEKSTDGGIGAERLEKFDGADEGHTNSLGF